MSAPWRPPSLAQFGSLGIGLETGGASLQQASVHWTPSYRAIVSEYAGENLYDRIAGAEEAELVQEIADLTNPHILAQTGQLNLVPPEDRIYGHGSGMIMAAFTWPVGPSRFSDGRLGTYYAAAAEETSIAETAYHMRARILKNGGATVVEMTLLHAELNGDLVDIRVGQPCPPRIYDPDDYGMSQQFGALVRRLGGYGIAYDSVRDHGRECAAIFRPPVLSSCSAVRSMEYEWDGAQVVVR